MLNRDIYHTEKVVMVNSDFVLSSSLDHCGEQRLKPGLKKCKFTEYENRAPHIRLFGSTYSKYCEHL